MQDGTRLAAVDLGSNSFRLEIGRIEHDQFYRTEYLKETIRQGSGLDEERNLRPEAMQRGWDCLARFGERLAGFDNSKVSAVATQTLREARNREEFLRKASQILGFPISVISGREEARLIYQGVSQSLRPTDERRLVVDIGGRSTELILGKGWKPKLMESYRVGSITWSTRYFCDDQFTLHAFQMAEIAAKAVLDEAVNAYGPDQWELAYGSAGTVGAIGDILVAAGWPAGHVNREGLDWLQEKLISAKSADRLRLPGLKEDRRSIIGGGLSVLRAIFDLLQIERLQVANGGLRHGVLLDLMGSTLEHTDVRTRSVQRLESKFGTDTAHGLRVAKVALELLAQLRSANAKNESLSSELGWAAQLHEIGSRISHSDYHKHSAYILDNSDALGFSLPELHRLSQLVLGHRGKLRKLEVNFEDAAFTAQLFALRLAVILCHARRDPDLGGLQLTCNTSAQRTFSISLRNGWEQTYPQSAHSLREEVLAWQKTPWSVVLEAC